MNRRPAMRPSRPPSAPTAPAGRRGVTARPARPAPRKPADDAVPEPPDEEFEPAPPPVPEPFVEPERLGALLPMSAPVGPPPGRPANGTGRKPPTRPGRGPRLPATVSATSAERFAARVRARRRSRWLLGSGGVLLASGLAWTALGSPWLRVQQVEVTGLHRVPMSLVAEAVGAERGRPLLLLRSGTVAGTVRRDPRVADVEVHRVWPDAVRIEVRERVPIAAVPAPSGVRLVDADGREIAVESRPPDGLPLVQVDLMRAGAGALRSAVAVTADLPADLRALVRTVGADSQDGVWLRLDGGVTVQWGDAGQNALKADVLRRLLPHKAVSYDVSAPAAPAVGPKRESGDVRD